MQDVEASHGSACVLAIARRASTIVSRSRGGASRPERAGMPAASRLARPAPYLATRTEQAVQSALHMIEARCRYALVVLVPIALVITGCEDMLLVELGRGQVGQVLIDRTFPTGLRPYEECPELRLSFTGGGGRGGNVTVAPLSDGCLLAVHIDDAVLLGDRTMDLWADALAGYDMNALIAIDIIIDELLIDGGARVPLGLDRVRALSIALDERVMVDRDDIASMEAHELRVPIPQGLVDSFGQALDERRAFTGDLDIRLVLARDVQIPRVVHVRALLQPVLLVDGWNAAF